MNIKLIYRLSGYLAIVVGIAAAICMGRMYWLLHYGIPLAILGFILSGINIFLNVKHDFEGEKYPKGYLAMFLSSLPVIFMMLIIFKFKK
jgi:hypothetical protein